MASIVLTVMAKTLYSDSPGVQSMPELWKSLHRHWARPSESKPAAPSSASVADLQKTTAPKTPPKHPGSQNVQRPPATTPTIAVDDEQMFQATQRSSYEQLREQISQRAKGRSPVDFYMTPLLSYMFFCVALS